MLFSCSLHLRAGIVCPDMKRILIIDDEEKVLAAYKRLLEEEGFAVFTARSATEGTRMLIREEEMDLVLLDINMFEVDGGVMKEVIDEYDPQLKVVVSSVRPLEEQKEIIPEAADYFDKSQGTDLLLKKVKKVLDTH